MKRIKSIDTFRGLCMIWLVSAHIIPQWLIYNQNIAQLYSIIWNIIDSIGACAFLFLSGISSYISYKKRAQRAIDGGYTMKRSRNEYYFRALIIFIMGFIVNIGIAIVTQKWWWAIAWDFLISISVCLFLAWPLFKTSRSIRIMIAILLWIINEIILFFIGTYTGEEPPLLFRLLYTDQSLDSPLWFFTFFLIGTVFGELLFKALNIEDNGERKKYLKCNLLVPSFIISIILITTGIILEFPIDLTSPYVWASIRSFPWRIHAIGIDMLLISILIFLEEYEILKFKKNYRFLFYFSYYSFTVYGTHYILTVIFIERFNADIFFWMTLFITLLLYGLLLNISYKKLGPKISIKAQISRMSVVLANIIEERKNNKKRL
ncbi:MAG: heparan-alpha-glucosaminide N-acetyltransferase domain-containing protein [Promethearchaeota archaeon]